MGQAHLIVQSPRQKKDLDMTGKRMYCFNGLSCSCHVAGIQLPPDQVRSLHGSHRAGESSSGTSGLISGLLSLADICISAHRREAHHKGSSSTQKLLKRKRVSQHAIETAINSLAISNLA